jgi:glyoxylase-like metal-dependent hydrolase (beta-lactamase superfamily II)
MKKVALILSTYLLVVMGKAQDVHELPSTSNGDNIPYPKGYIVYEIKDSLFYVGDGIYNTMFLVYDKGVVAVDAPPTLGEKYLQAIKEITQKPVTHVIYSHSHTDHIGAAYLFPSNAKYIAQDETAAILRIRKDKRRPLPTVTFKGSYTLKLGKQTLQLDYKGNNHEPGNIFIYAPRQKTLMLVDIVYPGWVPFKNLGIAQDVQGYMKAHDDALGYAFDKIVSGHVNRIGTRQDVIISKEFVADLKVAAITAFGKVNIMETIKEIGTENKWKMYNTYFEKVVSAAELKMKEKWNGKLGGLSTYLHDDCWIMCEAVSVDFALPEQH